MTETENTVLQSLENSWLALCQRYDENPTEETRCVMNLLGQIIRKAKGEAERKRKAEPKQISIEEWLAWFKEEVEE